MKIKLVFALTFIIAAYDSFVIPNVMANGTLFQVGYDHGCSHAKLPFFSERYINQPNNSPSFNTQYFVSVYNAGFRICRHESLPIVSTVDSSGSNSSNSPLFKQGYAKGVSDAKSQQSTFPASTIMHSDDVDCDSDVDPKASNEDYCLGYQHGFADTNNKLLLGR